MTYNCVDIKAHLEDLLGKSLSDKAKLVALLDAFGIHDRETVERLLECKPSTLRQARSALKIQRQKSSAVDASARNPAPEIQRSAGNPAKTPEIQRQKSSDPSRARAYKESPTEIVLSKNQQQQQQQQPEKHNVVDANNLHEKLVSAAGDALSPLSIGLQVCAEPLGWINGGADLDLDIVPVVKALSKSVRAGTVNSWKYYRNAVIQARDSRLAGLPSPVAPKGAQVVPFKVTTATFVKPAPEPAYDGRWSVEASHA